MMKNFPLSRTRRVLAGMAVTSCLVSLSGCFPLLMGGAVTSALVATDRRSSGMVLEDNTIQLKAGSRLSESLGDRGHIDVTSYNRQVLLTGEVPTPQDKQLAEKLVAEMDNVKGVTNELAVMGNSTLTQRSSDLLVGSRVRGHLIDAKDLISNAFKVVTERGTVYVMGRVTPREAKRATEVIRGVDGVQRLVILWEVISEDELARMLPAPPASEVQAR